MAEISSSWERLTRLIYTMDYEWNDIAPTTLSTSILLWVLISITARCQPAEPGRWRGEY